MVPVSVLRRYRSGRSRRGIAVRLVLLVTALLAASAGVLAAPAQAAEADCPAGYFCFWVDGGYGPSNAMGMVNTSVPDLSVFPNSRCPKGTWNDCISSYANHTNRTVHLFEQSNYNDDDIVGYAGWINVPPNDAQGVMPWWWKPMGDVTSNDQVSSIRFV